MGAEIPAVEESGSVLLKGVCCCMQFLNQSACCFNNDKNIKLIKSTEEKIRAASE